VTVAIFLSIISSFKAAFSSDPAPTKSSNDHVSLLVKPKALYKPFQNSL
jgi:hypothetical protein